MLFAIARLLKTCLIIPVQARHLPPHLNRCSRLWNPLVYTSLLAASVADYQFSSVAHSCLTLFDPMDYSTPGLPVHHQLPEFTQTHAIQLSHPLSSPSPPAFNLSQHQGLFKWVSFSHQVAKVLWLQVQHQSLNEYSVLISLGWTGWISLQSKGCSRVFSNTTVRKHQFFGAQTFLFF